ncbi:aminodeoxychorismate/anthranilate synthase component II [Buchnera aphidicola]|uniref:aminodeoxychorismate/anthranilate synthase component II n=1 Tax=Buchnera aphidicola TaxID=9 RepID=UPI0031B87AFE
MNDVLILDNLDSFTYNLVDMLKKLNQNVIIYRNTIPVQTIILALTYMKNPIIILSPGPGTPKNSGCLLKIIKFCKGKIPIFGICLGYQAIVSVYGGKICYANEIMHGKVSYIVHDQLEMFLNVPNPLLVARYHSLICDDIPKNLIVNARSKNTIMAIRNNYDRICGLQFHPESILTVYGEILLKKHIQWLRS